VNLESAISVLAESVPDPDKGLPDELFYYISQTTPLINVDLLIQDENGRTLLAWRDDQYAGQGWHIPGGILRFKETLETRILQVAISEIGQPIDFDPAPIAIHQMVHKSRDIRGHFLSFLYQCTLPSLFVPRNVGKKPGDSGYLAWHEHTLSDLLPVHEVYRAFIDPGVCRQRYISNGRVEITAVL